jgi:diamine N-acetyltransferase
MRGAVRHRDGTGAGDGAGMAGGVGSAAGDLDVGCRAVTYAASVLTLRATTSGDLVHVAAWEDQADTSVWLGETGRAWHEAVLADPDQEHLIAEDAGGPAGFAVLAGVRTGDGAIEVRRMVVSPAFRGTGRGRALLRAALARARCEHRAAQVWLDVKPHNVRARRLYESEGFVLTRTIASALTGPDGATTDLLVMTRDVLATRAGNCQGAGEVPPLVRDDDDL